MRRMRQCALLCTVLSCLSLPSIAGLSAKRLRAPIPLELVAGGIKGPALDSGIALSPDGQWLAYADIAGKEIPWRNGAYLETGVPRVGGHALQVSVMNTQTREVIRLGKKNDWSWAPAWSVDGKKLAYYSDEGGEAGLWVWDRTTQTKTRFPNLIVRPHQRNEAPQWLPDGRHLLCKILPAGLTLTEANKLTLPQEDAPLSLKDLFPKVAPHESSVLALYSAAGDSKTAAAPAAPQAREMSNSPADLALLDLATFKVTRLSQDLQVRGFLLSPDGKRVAYSIFKGWEANGWRGRFDLVVYNMENATTRTVLQDAPLSYFGDGWDWSAKGNYIAYVTHKQSPDGAAYRSVLVLASSATGAQRELEKENVSFSDKPLWDSTEVNIYLLGSEVQPQQGRQSNPQRSTTKLWRIEVASGVVTRVGEIAQHDISSLITPPKSATLWHPTRSGAIWVTAAQAQDGESWMMRQKDLYELNLKSSTSRLAAKGSVFWTFVDANAHTGDIAYRTADFQHPESIWLFNTRSGRTRQLTIYPEWERYELGAWTMLQYQDAQGKARRGALMLPPGYRKGQRVPLIVFLFGTPNDSGNVNRFGLFGNAGAYNVHVLTTRGYAVLHPDLELEVGRQAQSVVDAVDPAVEEAIRQGYVDPERLGLIGYSMGSYPALALAVKSTRFKAAMISAINFYPDLFASYLMSQPFSDAPTPYEGQYGALAQGGTPWQFRERYLENSPAVFFDRLTMPLLIAQGTNDGLFSSNSIFSSLKRLRKNAEYLIYENDNHTIGKEPNVIDFWKRRLQFADKHLDISRDTHGHMVFDGNRAKSRQISLAP